jgi:hypothetical protein
MLRDALQYLGPKLGADLNTTGVASIVDHMIANNESYSRRDDAAGEDYATWRNRSRECLSQLEQKINDLQTHQLRPGNSPNV